MKVTPRIEVGRVGVSGVWLVDVVVRSYGRMWSEGDGQKTKRGAVRKAAILAAQLGNLPVYVDGEKVEG